MKKLIKISNTTKARKELLKLKGKKIQIVTSKGKRYSGILYSVGKGHIVIKKFQTNKNGLKTSWFIPVFIPIPFPFFFVPIFF